MISREETIQKIASIKYWYHQIELMPGVVTPGVCDPTGTLAEIHPPEDCHGLKVLDIGTADGFFAFEFERRGAEVVAMDYRPYGDSGFAVASEILGSRVKFVHEGVYGISPEKYGQFDIVLCLGLLYHLRDPLRALDIIRSVCRRTLYIESHALDNHVLLPDGSVTTLAAMSAALQELPLMQFYPGTVLNNDPTNYWGPNRKCLELMAVEAGFRVCESKLFGSRAILICEPVVDLSKEYHKTIAHGKVERV